MSQNESLSIRPLAEDDAGALIALVEQIAGSPTVAMTREEFAPTEQDERAFLRRYADPQWGLALGAWCEDRLTGALFLDRPQLKRRHHVLVLGMSVAPSCWGLGIGRALLNQGLAAACALEGILRVELSVLANNERGLALFRGAGFLEEGRKHRAILLSEGPVDELLFARLVGVSTDARMQ